MFAVWFACVGVVRRFFFAWLVGLCLLRLTQGACDKKMPRSAVGYLSRLGHQAWRVGPLVH